MDGVIVTSLRRIINPKGDIFHAMKKSDPGFNSFGEAYFSTVYKDNIKGWKKHTKMTLNIVVPFGEIEFVIYNEKTKNFFNIRLSQNNYKRLTLSPGLWMAFKGLSDENMLLNLASMEHDPNEAINCDIEGIEYEWL